MKTNLLYGLIALQLLSCIPNNFESQSMTTDWEFNMISEGENRPDFDPSIDSLHYIPILLHEGYTQKEIQTYFNWTDKIFKSKLELLLSSGFIKKKAESEISASLMIITINEAKIISNYLNSASDEITSAIEKDLDSIIYKTRSISCFSNYNFEDISLLILSNVLLDNGQIRNVENGYLKKERTNRGGKNYYASYQEKTKDSQYEALGIYGNKVKVQNSFATCYYGNQRLLEEVIELNKEIARKYSDTLERKTIKYPIVDSKCSKEIMELARSFTPKLLEILNYYDSMFREEYAKSKCSKDEISYEEYFIWTYHILYTKVTDELISRGHINIPNEKVAYYIFQP